MNYYLRAESYGRNRIKDELDLSNYTTKSDLKGATDINKSHFAKKADLANLKLDVDKLNINKSKTIPVNLNKSKLNNVVIVFKKTAHRLKKCLKSD